MTQEHMLPVGIEYSIELIREWWDLGLTESDVREIKVMETSNDTGEVLLSKAFLAWMNKDKKLGDGPTYSLDMDDTLVDYSGAKARFHSRVIDHIEDIESVDIDHDVLKTLLLHINKASRILPESGVHPEAYCPTLEIVALTRVISMLQSEGNWSELGEFETLIQQEADKQVLDHWVRSHVLTPVIESMFPESALTIERQNEPKQKTYFRQGYKIPELATAIDAVDVRSLQNGLNLGMSENALFAELYHDFQAEMFEPEIYDSLIPKIEDGGTFIVATYGEDRFQLEKMRRFIKRLEKLGLRTPDAVVLFEEGRKAPVLLQLLHKSKENDKNAQLIHVDNSLNQVTSVADLHEADLKSVHVKKTDLNKEFSSVISS